MVDENLKLENCTLGRGAYRNFAGERTQFNPAGKRTFVVILDEEEGHRIENLGWHIRWREPWDGISSACWMRDRRGCIARHTMSITGNLFLQRKERSSRSGI